MRNKFHCIILFTLFSFFVENTAIDRISKRKCQTYKDLIRKESPFFCDPNKICYYGYDCKRVSTGLVVGGEDALPGEFPHMAALGWSNKAGTGYEFLCGGSLISENFVLTAAHCLDNPRKLPSIVRLGELDLSSLDDGASPADYSIDSFILHGDYDKKSKKHDDIALIKLKSSVKFTDQIRPACLRQDNSNVKQVIAIGWGQNETYGSTTDILQKVTLNIITNEICEEEYSKEDSSEGNPIQPSHLCASAKRKDTCRGDSGGPLQVGHNDATCVFDILGITSHGMFECGYGPGVYTRVSSYLDWIEKKVWPGE